MPIRTQNNLPAKAVLENENIFVMDEDRAISQNIRPLEILILNLMPLKEDTEVQLLRALSNTPLQINITFLQTATYVSTHTAASHLNQFYLTFDNVKNRRFDGMIITGAPIEHLDFEQVDYWNELTEIMDWTKTNVTSTFHICWGAQDYIIISESARYGWMRRFPACICTGFLTGRIRLSEALMMSLWHRIQDIRHHLLKISENVMTL